MNNAQLFILALALAMDALAVAVATGMQLHCGGRGYMTPRHVFRLAFHFGLFQAFMPVLGWLAGLSVRGVIEQWDHWVAFALLAFVGVKMIREALCAKDDEKRTSDPTRGASLVLLSVATSIDALAVGLSFALLDLSIWKPAAVIGAVCCCVTACGMLLGSRAMSANIPGLRRLGHRAGLAGGIVLVLIGLRILWEHGVFAHIF